MKYTKIYKTREECPSFCNDHSWRKVDIPQNDRTLKQLETAIRLYYGTDMPGEVTIGDPFRVFLGYSSWKCMGCFMMECLKG